MVILTIYREVFEHVNVRGYIYIWANILWFVLSLPIVTAPAAWSGLVSLSRQAQSQPQVSLGDFWEGFRANLGRSVVISLVTLVILYVNMINIMAFQAESALFTGFLRVLWFSSILLWLSIQLYLWPLLGEMETPTLLGGLRNAVVMVLQNPLFTLGVWVGILALVVLSMIFFPAWFLLTGSVLAVLTTRATLNRLQAAGHQQTTVPVQRFPN